MPINFYIRPNGESNWQQVIALTEYEMRFGPVEKMEYVKSIDQKGKTITLVLNEVGETCFNMAERKADFLSLFIPKGEGLYGWHVAFSNNDDVVIEIDFHKPKP